MQRYHNPKVWKGLRRLVLVRDKEPTVAQVRRAESTMLHWIEAGLAAAKAQLKSEKAHLKVIRLSKEEIVCWRKRASVLRKLIRQERWPQ